MSLHCCAQAFSSCSDWGLLFVEVHKLLVALTSLAAEHRLQAEASVVAARGLGSCGALA